MKIVILGLVFLAGTPQLTHADDSVYAIIEKPSATNKASETIFSPNTIVRVYDDKQACPDTDSVKALPVDPYLGISDYKCVSQNDISYAYTKPELKRLPDADPLHFLVEFYEPDNVFGEDPPVTLKDPTSFQVNTGIVDYKTKTPIMAEFNLSGKPATVAIIFKNKKVQLMMKDMQKKVTIRYFRKLNLFDLSINKDFCTKNEKQCKESKEGKYWYISDTYTSTSDYVVVDSSNIINLPIPEEG
jgi:hypothetical protein